MAIAIKEVTMSMLERYAQKIKDDYAQWTTGSKLGELREPIVVTFQKGQKFIKIVTSTYGQRGVHSFICAKAHDKWKVGDILKAASWKAPAKNFSRGHITDPNLINVKWTSAM